MAGCGSGIRGPGRRRWGARAGFARSVVVVGAWGFGGGVVVLVAVVVVVSVGVGAGYSAVLLLP